MRRPRAPRAGRLARTLGACAALLVSCTSPDIDELALTCETSADCLAGRVCGERDGVRACIPAERGPLLIGMTGPFRGVSGELGVELRRGILAAFGRANAAGGVGGRQLELDSRNDDHDPALARANVEALLDLRAPSGAARPEREPGAVLALLGSVGSEAALATAPLANQRGVIMFSPFSGAHTYLRDGTHAPYVYHYRPGDFDEAEALVEYLASHRQPRIISEPPGDSYRRLLVIAQQDAQGDAGYAGLVAAYNRRAPLPQPDPALPAPSIRRIGHGRDDLASVDGAIAEAAEFLAGVLASAPAAASAAPASVGVVILGTYQPANKIVRALRDWLNADAERARRLDVLFAHLSSVGPDSLAASLTSPPAGYADVLDPSRQRSYAEGVMITQVVPSFLSEAPGVAAYREDIERFDGGRFGFTSLEGYIAARLFIEALSRCTELSAEDLRETLDTALARVDLGIGVELGFSPYDHQASQSVWGSLLRADGSASVPFVWSPDAGIRPN